MIVVDAIAVAAVTYIGKEYLAKKKQSRKAPPGLMDTAYSGGELSSPAVYKNKISEKGKKAVHHFQDLTAKTGWEETDNAIIVNSFDEWSPLKEVVIGSPINYELPGLELSFKLFFHDVAYSSFCYPTYEKATAESAIAQKNDSEQKDLDRGRQKRYVEELTEDVEELADTLRKLGIKVHRPMPLDRAIHFKTPYWEATGLPALNVRDQAIIIGNEIIETSPQVRARYFENDLLKPVFYEYFKAGSGWMTMPKPIMSDRSFDTSYVSGESTPAIQKVYSQQSSEFDVGFEMMIDAAQCIRFGKDILVNVASENHELGLKWLQYYLGGKFRFHRLYRFADNHIDSLVLPLRPGTLLVRNPGIVDKLPKALQKWDKIYAPEPKERIFPAYEDDDLILTSKFIDLNVLSIDEETVIVNSLFPELIDTLEKNGFTAIPVRHRHRRLFGGGFHCFTLDTVREGSLEDYFS
uniref:Glycine amidinotransferase n=1 Tax=Candidatus Kentrum sp. FM TaxID=2126340 RepID=A0A450W4I7_9GAMM|nr:MAG: glycine amidinotransferase [Candidatus Kentron sp. FM]VFJ65325.1 MAG: glycine amidinotransferase [Candidatus Kentron sp. FM]VFK11928.1 MAG: glycine amidinotransferase [Candidatus Kentron sp. FM]